VSEQQQRQHHHHGGVLQDQLQQVDSLVDCMLAEQAAAPV